MSTVLSEVLLSGFTNNSALCRYEHLVQSFSVLFIYCGGTSSVSVLQLQQSEHRKKKRMLSNRESARRSRQRKLMHVVDLTAQVSRLRNENSQILSTVNVTEQLYLAVEGENSILRAQLAELHHRLKALYEIIDRLSSQRNHINGVFEAG
ncbi:hypothetical protein Nepgr_026410 [Nepenthes gracilis]|uniref:BZIP domain-containing protein n=1 Tax=Nepenthes gracilis TaxID=150966 RepID=A0AAD3Y0D4_NEPGR|nr:hypothetical protein Nepgr_026410 [Nepenthes gracilis]